MLRGTNRRKCLEISDVPQTVLQVSGHKTPQKHRNAYLGFATSLLHVGCLGVNGSLVCNGWLCNVGSLSSNGCLANSGSLNGCRKDRKPAYHEASSIAISWGRCAWIGLQDWLVGMVCPEPFDSHWLSSLVKLRFVSPLYTPFAETNGSFGKRLRLFRKPFPAFPS
jgi:hypothetical protein